MGSGVHVVALYVLVLWVPGLAVGALLGMRGWHLAAAAPLLTYAVAGLAGPAFAWAGIAWSPGSAALLVVAIGVLGGALWAALRAAPWAAPRRTAPPGGEPPAEPHWSRAVHLRVAAATAAVAAFGAGIVWAGVGHLSAVPQDWDAAFHANGIRWIAETGQSSLVAMGQVNWYEDGVQIFYPNAYHLIAAVVLRTAGTDVPTVLNAQTVLLPGMLALSVVALVHGFRGRAVLAAAAAACSVSVTAFYDMLWRGPLLPYAAGLVLLPLAVVLLVDLLDASGLRARTAAGLAFALALTGLICLNPAMLFSAALFALPALVQRWGGRPRLLLREPLVVLLAGIGTAVLVLPQLLGSLGSADGEPFDWPADLTFPQAIGGLLTLSHGDQSPQWWLVGAAALGIVLVPWLTRMQWILVVGAMFGTMFVLAAASDDYWVNAVTRPWWNDRWRLIGLCVVPIAVLAGHGIAELQRWAVLGARRLTGAGTGRAGRAVPIVATGLVVLLFAGLSDGLSAGRNVARMAKSAPDGPVVSSLEVDAMKVLAQLVPPGQRVLNDRGDGSVWMYAVAGVLPVAGHYDATRTGPDARLLAARFNEYPRDPAVRAAVERLDVSYVMLGKGFVRPEWTRQPGLTGLATADWLERVYVNPDAVIYRIRSDVPSRG